MRAFSPFECPFDGHVSDPKVKTCPEPKAEVHHPKPETHSFVKFGRGSESFLEVQCCQLTPFLRDSASRSNGSNTTTTTSSNTNDHFVSYEVTLRRNYNADYRYSLEFAACNTCMEQTSGREGQRSLGSPKRCKPCRFWGLGIRGFGV